MDLAVDHAGQNVQPACLVNLVRTGGCQVADFHNPFALHANINAGLAAGSDNGAATQDQVKCLGHSLYMLPLAGHVIP